MHFKSIGTGNLTDRNEDEQEQTMALWDGSGAAEESVVIGKRPRQEDTPLSMRTSEPQ